MDTCSLAPRPRGSATCAVSVRALAMPRAGWHVNSGCRRFPVNCQCQWALSRAALAPDLPDPAPALAGDAAVPACGPGAGEQVDTAHSAEDPPAARGPERGRTAVFLSSCLSGDAPAAGTSVAGCCNIAGHNLNRHGVDSESSRAPHAQTPAGVRSVGLAQCAWCA
jgi:hypothetical protein